MVTKVMRITRVTRAHWVMGVMRVTMVTTLANTVLPFHKQKGQVKIRPANLVHINRSAHSIFTIALFESSYNMHANAILM